MPRKCCAGSSMYGPCNTGWATSPWRLRCVIWRQPTTFTTKWTWLLFRLSARPNRRSESPQCARPVPLGRRTRDDWLPGARDRYLRSRYSLARDQADFKSRRTLGADALAERVRSGWVLGWADLAFLARLLRESLNLMVDTQVARCIKRANRMRAPGRSPTYLTVLCRAYRLHEGVI